MKKIIGYAGFTLGLILSIGLSSYAEAASTTAMTLSYLGAGANTNNCNTKDTISVVMPTGAGPYPVFLYMVGTTETFTNASAMAEINGMAQRGYIAATIQYNSATFSNCTGIQAKAACIFNPNSSASAITALCGLKQAECTHGLVTAGFSQGAVMGTQSKNFDASVVASYGMGDGVMYTSSFNLTQCQANGNRTLGSNRLMAINGVNDQFTGNTQATQQTNMQSLTGFTCPDGASSCIQENGSGWIIVGTTETVSGVADHCYMRNGGCSVSENSLDSGWANGQANWELNRNLNFLNEFINNTK